MHRKAILLFRALGSVGFAALSILPAAAQQKYRSVHTAIIEASGPKPGDNGTRYFNVEGKDKGKYACWGLVLFDGAAIKADLEKRLGKGKYKITGLSLELTQSNASFTVPGAVNIYYLAGKFDMASLKYPIDLKGDLKPIAVSGVKFAIPGQSALKSASGTSPSEAAAHVDRVDLMKSVQGADLPVKLLSGPVFSLAFVEVQPGVAATWAGQSNNRLSPPVLIVTASPVK